MRKQLCTIALSGLLALGFSAVASAQDATPPPDDAMQSQGNMQGPRHGGNPGGNPDEQLARMTKRYKLSADQQTQVKPILVAHQQEMMQLMSDSSMSRADKMAKRQSLRQENMQKIDAVLTPDQKAKFDSDQTKMEQNRMNRMQGGGAPPDAGSEPPPQ